MKNNQSTLGTKAAPLQIRAYRDVMMLYTYPPHLRLRAISADFSLSRPREANSSAELNADRSR